MTGITLKYRVQLKCNMKQYYGKKLFLYVSRNSTNNELVNIKIPPKCRDCLLCINTKGTFNIVLNSPNPPS